MKKLLFAAVAVFAFNAVSAQSRDKGDIELTPVIGYSSSNYYGEDNMDNSTLSSVSFGVDADYFFNDRWSLRSGLLYQAMGSELNSSYKEELNYLTIPVNANWHFGSTRKWNLNFGPSVGFLMKAEANGVDVKDFAKSTQIGFNYGIGYKIAVTENFSILIDYQGMTGLTKIADEGDNSIKNLYSAFNVGAVLKL